VDEHAVAVEDDQLGMAVACAHGPEHTRAGVAGGCSSAAIQRGPGPPPRGPPPPGAPRRATWMPPRRRDPPGPRRLSPAVRWGGRSAGEGVKRAQRPRERGRERLELVGLGGVKAALPAAA